MSTTVTDRRPLLGDEAAALAAIHSGLSGAFSYPGTPATEIFEFVHQETHGGPPAREGGVHCVWSANEKVAYEEALGMSYAGRRALVSFKHVGLNVAADPFMNSAVTGVKGGLVVAVADDPGMHSSQDEQDSRVYANFALIPCFEPANGQQAYDMTREAYELSEAIGLPVMLRLTTRLAHSRSGVALGQRRPPNPLAPATRESSDWTLLPSNARRRYSVLTSKQEELVQRSERSGWNSLVEGSGRLGVIASGIGYNYFMECYADGERQPPPHLRLGMYPIPRALVARLFDMVDEVLVLEDGYPFIETALRGVLDRPRGKKILGRQGGQVPRTGELNPDNVRQALGFPALERQEKATMALPGRPPSLCDGCPHIDSYGVIRVILDAHPTARVFSDIGCYTLGAYAPYSAANSCVCMGASISMAMGAAAAGMWPVLCTIGDSTFVHSGMTPLIGAAKENLNMVVFILDNSTVAMTGGQVSLASGEDLLRVVKGLGVHPEHVHVIRAHRKDHEANVELVKREIAYPGLSVIIPTRECVVTARK